MIEPLSSSTGKNVGQNGKLRPPSGHSLPDFDKSIILRNPRQFAQNKEPLKDSFFENLIQENIINKNSNSGKRRDHFAVRAGLIASEVRALINTLSDAHKIKLKEIVKALEPDKEMLRGAVFSGGEIRVVAECGAVIVINTLAELLGIVYSKENPKPTFSHFSGGSAGSFPAAGMAFRSLNSSIFKTSADTDFRKFFNAPDALKKWVEVFMKRGYNIATGKHTHEITGEHLDELGSDLQVLVAGFRRRILIYPQVYLLPRELESKFGIDSKKFKIKDLIRATANLPLLFYPLTDLFKTCGNCFLEDNKGTKYHLFDPGIVQKYLTPLNLQLEEIEQYMEGKIDKPGFYFIVGNKPCKEDGVPEKMFGQPTNKAFYWIYAKALTMSNIIDKYILGESSQVLKKVGAQRAYVTSFAEATNPITKKVAKLQLGGFDISSEDRGTLICANIPTSDYKDLPFDGAIDQLHKQLVDPLFIQSEGKQGKSAYQLFKDDIDKAIGKENKNEPAHPGFSTLYAIKRLAGHIRRIAPF